MWHVVIFKSHSRQRIFYTAAGEIENKNSSPTEFVGSTWADQNNGWNGDQGVVWVEWFAGAILKNTQHHDARWSWLERSYRSEVARRFIPGRPPRDHQRSAPPTQIHIPAACTPPALHPPGSCTTMHVMQEKRRKTSDLRPRADFSSNRELNGSGKHKRGMPSSAGCGGLLLK